MNAQRRKILGDIAHQLDLAAEELYEVITEERWALDNVPESFQETDAYCDRENYLDELEEAADDIRSAVDHINSE